VDAENTETERLGAALEEYADFIGPIKVVEVAGKGRGVVASKDISKGTLLLCDRALALAESGNVAELVFDLIKDDNDSARRAYNLYAGGAEKPPLQGESKLPVDHLFVLSALEFNHMSELQQLPRVSDPVTDPRRGEKPRMSGIWAIASMFNHSCVPNTTRNFAGSSMIIFAVEDIRAGDEITMGLCPKDMPFAGRTEVCRLF